mmetsp:Transcript_157927/g.506526  ORF Transcript_157927/g.506526 Transcript_157927/m.506526 type:complete len:330 (+) Transcript_157927:139-1128(+)
MGLLLLRIPLSELCAHTDQFLDHQLVRGSEPCKLRLQWRDLRLLQGDLADEPSVPRQGFLVFVAASFDVDPDGLQVLEVPDLDLVELLDVGPASIDGFLPLLDLFERALDVVGQVPHLSVERPLCMGHVLGEFRGILQRELRLLQRGGGLGRRDRLREAEHLLPCVLKLLLGRLDLLGGLAGAQLRHLLPDHLRLDLGRKLVHPRQRPEVVRHDYASFYQHADSRVLPAGDGDVQGGPAGGIPLLEARALLGEEVDGLGSAPHSGTVHRRLLHAIQSVQVRIPVDQLRDHGGVAAGRGVGHGGPLLVRLSLWIRAVREQGLDSLCAASL